MPMKYKLIASDALDKYNTFEVQDILKKHMSPPVSWPIKVGVLLFTIHFFCVPFKNIFQVLYRVYDVATQYDGNVPPVVPVGEYKTSIGYFLDENRKMAQVDFFVKTF